MKIFKICPEAESMVGELEATRILSEACVRNKVCPFCALEMKFNNENVVDKLVCTNENCDTAYDFNKFEWGTKAEVK